MLFTTGAIILLRLFIRTRTLNLQVSRVI